MALNLESIKNDKKELFYLDGNTLKPEDLFQLGLGNHKIDVSKIEPQKNVFKNN